ncbi:TPR repeat protein oca3 [Escovopsis weberi]|uniref:ER membrane protein complex subunit 2 n=1 Tax=Escovopsis weberi TaxID=150374 RepID=A0A0M8MSH5_ESCWE|nr:TPR repeat protein oca3 [Escovopsis weberi]
MPLSIFRPQGSLSPAEALELAQQAPELLRKNPKAFSASPFFLLFSAPETTELWTSYENLIIACLRTGKDNEAKQFLERLVLRFGGKDERVEALKGLVREAQATSDAELSAILKEYEDLLTENDTNIASIRGWGCEPIAKRRIALLRSMGKTAEAIEALGSVLDFSPTDGEAWMELGDLYLSQGLYLQAIYSIEEALVLVPNAWNLHARAGEVLMMAAEASTEVAPQKYLAESLKRFCRSIELCEDYLRGYYGLKLVTDRILDGMGKTKKQTESDGFALPDQSTLEKLNVVAITKLTEMVRRYEGKEKLWQGYDAGEMAAAKALLAKSSAKVVR